MKIRPFFFAAGLVLLSITFYCTSCKSCKKAEPAQTITSDTTTHAVPLNTINLPHADTSLIPILTKVLNEAFDASIKKDYAQLASFIVYRGPDSLKFGYDVFNAKN